MCFWFLRTFYEERPTTAEKETIWETMPYLDTSKRDQIEAAVFLISQEKTFFGVSFLNKVAGFKAWRPATLLKRDSNAGVFLQSLRNFQEHLFYRPPPVAASSICLSWCYYDPGIQVVGISMAIYSLVDKIWKSFFFFRIGFDSPL